VNRREILVGSGCVLAIPLAGCSSGGDGGDPSDGASEETESERPARRTVGDGSTTPKGVVRDYIRAIQGYNEEMAAIVHPDGTAATEPDPDGEPMTRAINHSITVTERSETQATVVVTYDLTGGEEMQSGKTTYSVRTYEGSWYVYSRERETT